MPSWTSYRRRSARGCREGGSRAGCAVVNFAVRRIRKMVPPYALPGHLRFMDVLEEGRGQARARVTLGPDEIAFLQYTGGTTGVAKGAVLTHRNLVANLLQCEAWMEPALHDTRRGSVR